MNADRRAQLEKKAGRRLASAFRKVLKPPAVASIDIEMFWPPDHDGLHFLVQADKTEIDWDFSIPTADWQRPTDPVDDFTRHAGVPSSARFAVFRRSPKWSLHRRP
jgi:hypothetical protein